MAKEIKIKVHTIRLIDSPQLHKVATLRLSNPDDDFWYISWGNKDIAKIYEAELLVLVFELLKLTKKRTEDVRRTINKLIEAECK